MRKYIAILALLFLAGCTQKYIWNETSGKAGEGRCHLLVDGKIGPIVKTELCR